MSKWKCEICNKEFDNFYAQGFNNKIYCPLCYFKEENELLNQRIKFAIEYAELNLNIDNSLNLKRILRGKTKKEREKSKYYYDMWDKLKEYLLDDGWSEVSGEVAVILVLNKMENLEQYKI